jgi:phasin family protein
MASTAQTAKAAADQAAEFGQEAFKTTVDRSIAAFDGFASNSKLNFEAMTDSLGLAAESAQTLSAQAAAFTKQALEDQVITAKKLAACKSVQEALDVQTGFVKSSVESYLAELGRWSDAMAASTQRSLKPLNDRFATAAEQLAVIR